TPRSRRDPVVVPGLAAATAAAEENAGDAGDAAADHEPGDRGRDERFSSVVAQLLAPVGQRRHLFAQHLDRGAELLAVLLDRGADLLWRSGRRHQEATSVAVTVSRIFLASSIAIVGAGGVPLRSAR